MKYVECPETITSPAPSPEFTAATGLGANEPCGLRVPIVREGPVMDCRCAYGHRFIAQASDVREG